MTFFDPTGSTSEVLPVQGYVAFAEINGTAVYPTGGVANNTRTPSLQEFFANGAFPGLGIMTRALHAHGTEIEGGSINFDFANRGGNLLDLIDAENRGIEFSVRMGTQTQALKLDGCRMEQLVLQASPRSVVSGSISFKSAQRWCPTTVPLLVRSTLISYWATGGPQMEDWSLSIRQSLTPVYPNDVSDPLPKYLRVGKTQGSLSVTTVGGLKKTGTVNIGTGSVEVVGVVNEQALQLATRGRVNRYTYSVDFMGEVVDPPPMGSGGPLVKVVIT